jgi:hypothetical protein
MSLRKGRRLEVGGQSLIDWLSMPVPVFATQLTHAVRIVASITFWKKYIGAHL